ncbi:anti-sigma factor [Rhodoferax saidenbachensis]|uniref:Anti-sigma factor RsiW n=1 Tax=Rhodoferax saidenbachensis TaxID=1484693 RepID=A0ABU1ZII3_9BURK|nr:anti-sigma factor [Rhodoferax saidenbachensis]MDR7305178.1 anti-sigma factor RsiW [Rhodoferax saidenbachensis]
MTTPPPSSALSEDTLHALVDGRLDVAQRIAIEALLVQDPEAQASVARWRQQRTLLQGLHAELLHEAPPTHLTQAALGAVGDPRANAAWRWGGLAASILLSFTVGWFAHGQWRTTEQLAQQTPRKPTADFVRQASLAHAVYAPEVRHPVEVGSAEQEHLVKWLSKRLGRPLKVPDLTGQGYELVGGRLLPGDAGVTAVRAQFMFQNTAGERLTLYLGAVQGDGAGVNTQESAFRFANEGTISSFYWVDQGFGYALTGPVPRDRLMQLAQTVYQQL